jgi:endonuclease/exonuclease/phosphatase family metal-dependent hydrolase
VTGVSTDTVDLTSPPDRGVATRLALLAVVTTLVLELIRSSGALLDRAFASGALAAASAAVLTYAAPALLAVVVLVIAGTRTAAGRVSGFPSGRAVLIGTVALGALRLVVQALDGGLRVGLGLVTGALGVTVLTLTVAFVAARPNGGHQAALGLTLGLGASTGLQLALGTWDAYWRHSVLGWAVTVVLVVGAVLLARLIRTEVVGGRPRRLWVLGPYLALAAMILANPAFAASQDGARLAWAGGVLVIAAAVGFLLLLSPTRLTSGFRIASVVLLPLAIAGAFWWHGPWVLVCLVVAQAAAAVALATALGSRRSAPPTLSRTGVVSGVIGLGTILPLLGYQLDYDVPLGFPNAWVVVAAAVTVAGAGLRLRTPAPPGGLATGPAGAPSGSGTIRPERVPVTINPLRLLVLPSVALAVVGLWACAPTDAVPATSTSASLRLLDWNLHYGVSPATSVDLEQIARTIEAQHPDVVTLQEVSRGWVMGGGADVGTWLSHRLGMQMVFVPAADRQFGNVILSRSRLSEVLTTALPYGEGPQQRSAISATVTLAGDTPLRVTSVHLQHRSENTATRLSEIATLLAAQPTATPRVIGGDLNAEPGSVEIQTLTGAGWSSALDVAGGAAGARALTSPSDVPVARIDWVLGQQVTFTDAQVLTAPRSSDHLPVVTTVAVAP